MSVTGTKIGESLAEQNNSELPRSKSWWTYSNVCLSLPLLVTQGCAGWEKIHSTYAWEQKRLLYTFLDTAAYSLKTGGSLEYG